MYDLCFVISAPQNNKWIKNKNWWLILPSPNPKHFILTVSQMRQPGLWTLQASTAHKIRIQIKLSVNPQQCRRRRRHAWRFTTRTTNHLRLLVQRRAKVASGWPVCALSVGLSESAVIFYVQVHAGLWSLWPLIIWSFRPPDVSFISCFQGNKRN